VPVLHGTQYLGTDFPDLPNASVALKRAAVRSSPSDPATPSIHLPVSVIRHGAAPNNFMSHLAIWEAPESGAESEWRRAELVTDEEYLT